MTDKWQLILAIFPFVFVGMWITMAFIISRLSGWSRLAEKYICTDSSALDWRAFRSGAFGIANYRYCLWIAFTAEGLYLKTGPAFFFRPFHPKLRIPWSAVESAEEKKVLFRCWVEIKLMDPQMSFVIYSKDLLEIERFIGRKMKRIEISAEK